jgi:hypothetical protein
MKTLLSHLLCAGLILSFAGSSIAAEGAWIGRRAYELLESWGQPTKIKNKGDGRSVFVYKMDVLGDGTAVVAPMSFSDVGVGPQYMDSAMDHAGREGQPTQSGPKIIPGLVNGKSGRIKAVFRISAHGRIVDQEIKLPKSLRANRGN